VLNARVDSYLVQPGAAENFAETVKRANAYRQAGAGCVFVPGPMDRDTIVGLVREIDGPLNVLGARAGTASALSIPDLERLGVKRVSICGSLSAAVLSFVQQSMRALRETGTFDYAHDALPNTRINAIMDKYRSR